MRCLLFLIDIVYTSFIVSMQRGVVWFWGDIMKPLKDNTLLNPRTGGLVQISPQILQDVSVIDD